MDHRAYLRERFPELHIATFETIGEGWDSDAYEVNGAWIFRFPRRPVIIGQLRKEATLLPALAPTLPGPVPVPELVCTEPVACLGHRKLEGRALDPAALSAPSAARLAEQLGAFLAALHRFPVERALALGVPGGDAAIWRTSYREVLDQLGRQVLPCLEPDEAAVAGTMLEGYLEDDANFAFEPRLAHCDLGPEHILAGEDGALAGVLDWGDSRVGDPAIDLAWVLHGVPSFGERAFAAYLEAGAEVDATFRARALFLHRIGPWYEVAYGLETEQPRFVASGLAGVRSRLPD